MVYGNSEVQEQGYHFGTGELRRLRTDNNDTVKVVNESDDLKRKYFNIC